MMKKYISSTLLALALLLACQNNTVPQHTEATPQQLQVSVALQNPTKAPVVGTAFDHEAQIKILLEDADGSGTDYNVAQVYKLDRQDPTADGAWASVVTPGLMVKYTKATVKAIYPHDAELEEGYALVMKDTPELDLGEMNKSDSYSFFNIAIDPAKPSETAEVYVSKEEIDYMFGKGTDVWIEVGKNTQHTTITMKHIRAMVVVKLTKDPTYMGADELRAIEFSNKNLADPSLCSAEYNTVMEECSLFSPTRYKRTMSKFPVGTHFALLANPAKAAAGKVSLVVTLGSTNHIFNLPALNWESGKVYLYTVRLTPSGVALDNQVTMLDWPSPLKHSIELN